MFPRDRAVSCSVRGPPAKENQFCYGPRITVGFFYNEDKLEIDTMLSRFWVFFKPNLTRNCDSMITY